MIRRSIRHIPFALALGLLLAQGFGLPARSRAGVGDQFGYTVQSETFSWVDISGTGTGVAFPSSDNSFVGPVAIGFSVPFYENDYSSLYISTNGIVTFGEISLAPNMAAIPFSGSPNNFAAPLWDDLDVGGVNSGEVYYDLIGTAPNRTFVVAFENVTRTNSPGNPLSFETLFHENGDICFQYDSLSGDLSNAVAGIEDSDGVDGVDQTGGIAGSTHFCFLRPGAAARGKITPAYQSGFVSSGQRTFTFTVKNTGELGTDTYDLDYSSSAGGWTAEFFLLGTREPLPDTNGNTIPDTGPIPEGGSVSLGVAVTAPAAASAGAWSNITVTAASQIDPGAEATALAGAAVSPAFSQLYRDSSLGLRIAVHSSPAELTTPNLGTGSIGTVTMAASIFGNHHVFWENSYLNSVGNSVTDILYSVTLPQGAPIELSLNLTNQAAAALPTRDKFPSAASNSTGRIGIVFVRDIIDTGLNPSETNSNVYLQVLNADGSNFSGPVNLTNNNDWRGPNDFGESLFEAPRVASVGTSFLVSWIDNRLQSSTTEEDDVVFAVVSQNGLVSTGPAVQANSTPGGDLYFNPAVAGLSGDRALLVYTQTDEEGVAVGMHYAVRDSGGGVVKAETALAGAVGSGIDAVQLGNGNILVAWIDSSSEQVEYAVLNSGYNLIFGPSQLTTPGGRQAIYVSATSAKSNQGVLTWMDATGSQYIYYALLGSGGAVVTPPMAIRSAASPVGFVLTSSSGGGNAPNQGGLSIFLPIIKRE
jgi:hypothetical protein